MTLRTLPRRPFFKYASPATTLAILRSRSVRYSSPTTFNDPFDFQSGLHFDFSINSLFEALLDRLGEYAAASEPPRVDTNEPWGRLILKARQYFPTHGFPREKWEAFGSEPFRSIVNAIKDTQQKYQDHWRNTLLPGIRVFSVSEERDNLLMWAHYGKDHTGAVLEFWSLPDEDNLLSVARPVQYVTDPPAFFSQDEFVDDILSVKTLDLSDLARRYAFAKSEHWRYEHEWRVWYPLSESGLYDDIPISDNEFSAIYLGCQARSDFKAEALSVLRRSYPNVQVYQGAKTEGAYALDFTAV